MDIFEVDQKTCLQDGICAAVCPFWLIDFRPDGYPIPAAEAEKMCIKCGHCVAVCPTGSLTHREMPVEQCPPVQKALEVSVEQCEYFFRSRRSRRVYENKPVPREVLVRAIEIARYAPTGHNLQCVEWLVLTNKEELRRLKEIGADWMRWMIINEPELADFLAMERILRLREEGKDELLRDAPVVIVAHTDKYHPIASYMCTIALTHFELVANTMGLGCCWAGLFNQAATTFPPMMEALSLQEGHQAFGCLMVGYPKYRYYRLPLRKPPRIAWRT